MLKVIGEDVNFFRGGAGHSIFPLEGAGFFNLEGGQGRGLSSGNLDMQKMSFTINKV